MRTVLTDGELLTATPEQLLDWTCSPHIYNDPRYHASKRAPASLAVLRDRVVAVLRAQVADREREAARQAWDAAWNYGTNQPMLPRATAARDRYLAGTYPTEPARVTLSDGSVVTDDPRNGENRIKWERDGATAWYAPEEVEVASRALPDTDRQAFLALAQRVEGQ